MNVKVNVKEGCRLQATGYRVERVESGRRASPKMVDRIWDMGGWVKIKMKMKIKERLQATGCRKQKGFWGREPVPEGFGEWLAGGRELAPRLSHPLGQHGRMDGQTFVFVAGLIVGGSVGAWFHFT